MGRIAMSDLPELAGWLTVPEAADDLSLSRQRVYQMIEEGKIKTCHRLGRRPVWIIREAEVRHMVEDKNRGAGVEESAGA